MRKLIILLSGAFLLLAPLQSCGLDEVNALDSKISFTYQPGRVLVDEPVEFKSSANGVDENTVYHWEFGDGASSNSISPIHTFTSIGSGSYQVKLTVQNSNRAITFSELVPVSYSDEISGRKSLIEKLSDEEILICAHRGNHKEHPENSIASVIDAIDKSIPMIEIDIRLSKDGQPVLMHDKTIDRTTSGSGNVADFTLKELKDFKLYNHNGTLTSQRIPSLKEVLELSRGKVYIDLDIHKKAPFAKVYAIVKKYGMVNQVLFYTKELAVINAILAKDSEALAFPNIGSDLDFNRYKDLNVKVVHFTTTTLNQKFVDRAKDRKWYILKNAYVNSTISPEDDNYDQIDKIINLTGNIIQTDHPVLVKQYID